MGETSTNGGFSLAMLDYQRVMVVLTMMNDAGTNEKWSIVVVMNDGSDVNWWRWMTLNDGERLIMVVLIHAGSNDGQYVWMMLEIIVSQAMVNNSSSTIAGLESLPADVGIQLRPADEGTWRCSTGPDLPHTSVYRWCSCWFVGETAHLCALAALASPRSIYNDVRYAHTPVHACLATSTWYVNFIRINIRQLVVHVVYQHNLSFTHGQCRRFCK